MKILVIYKSISGFTKKYAAWIALELGADCIDLGKADPKTLSGFDLLVFGGSLHAVGINGYVKFKSMLRTIGERKIVVFAVGATPDEPGIVEEIRSGNMKEPFEADIPLFYLRGGFDYSRLDLANKLLMKLLQWKLMLKRDKSRDDAGMLNAYKKPLDAARQKNIAPLVEYVRRRFSVP